MSGVIVSRYDGGYSYGRNIWWFVDGNSLVSVCENVGMLYVCYGELWSIRWDVD